jgi:hypothetical protein
LFCALITLRQVQGNIDYVLSDNFTNEHLKKSANPFQHKDFANAIDGAK